jgi:hypothetical protein
MTEDPRVHRLLDELFDSNATPEEVCGPCPDQLPVVRDLRDATTPPAVAPPPRPAE